MSSEDDFSGPMRDKASRGSLGLTNLFETARAGIKRQIMSMELDRVKERLAPHGRKVSLIKFDKHFGYARGVPLGRGGGGAVRWVGKMNCVVWVMDSTGNLTRGRAEFSDIHKIMPFATPFEKRESLLPLGRRSKGTVLVDVKGTILGWILTAKADSFFARSEDLWALMLQIAKASQVNSLKKISERNIEVVFREKPYMTLGGETTGTWWKLNRYIPEANVTALFDIHGELLDFLGADVPASAVSEGLGPLDYIGFAGVLKKFGARIIFVTISKGTATLGKVLAKIRTPDYWAMVARIKGKGALLKAGGTVDGMMLKLPNKTFLVRAENKVASGPGDYFIGPFKTLKEAEQFTVQFANMGRDQVRAEMAVLREWGSKMEVMRIYQTNRIVPALQGKIIPQTSKIGLTQPGGMLQLELPVWGVRNDFKTEIVTRVGKVIDLLGFD